MEVRRVLNGLGLALCIGAAAICLVLHVATFMTIISLVWIVPPFLLVAGAVLCSKAIEPRLRLMLRSDKVALLGWVLLVYAVLTFVYFYRTTGGASSVGIVDGQYVSKYKDHVIRVHCCPVKSRRESVGWHFRRNWRFGRWPEVRIKWAFSRKA
jgi:hypothetical protein